MLDDGFHYYQTRSDQGGKHQGWKDSGDAIVYEDGSQVEPPIATCEEQGFVYASKLQFAEVLWWMDKKDEARQLYREAQELKKRFNEVFWMEPEGFFAMGLDSKGEQIRVTCPPIFSPRIMRFFSGFCAPHTPFDGAGMGVWGKGPAF